MMELNEEAKREIEKMCILKECATCMMKRNAKKEELDFRDTRYGALYYCPKCYTLWCVV